MLTNNFLRDTVSRLGFGAMRLPIIDNNQESINQVALDAMVDIALESGVNYFDTAYPYHANMSEIALGKSLARHPRETFFLASKYPGHQLAETYDPAPIFEEQLKKCGVEYFDFYLLHNVYEASIEVYTDERWGIAEYFIEQKRCGRIRHLGFSCHGRPEKYELLTQAGIPIVVMEPLRGGKLANLSENQMKQLSALHPNLSVAAWAFEWLLKLENVKVILSGMSNVEQMEQNCATFMQPSGLTADDEAALLAMAESLKCGVPCTACRYCTETCPAQIDIPFMLEAYNDLRFATNFTVGMQMDAISAGHRASDCIACQACMHMCPQGIDIPEALERLSSMLDAMPKWADLCKERAQAAAKAKL